MNADLCAEETRSLVAGSSSRSGAASQESSRAESAEMAAGWQPGTWGLSSILIITDSEVKVTG